MMPPSIRMKVKRPCSAHAGSGVRSGAAVARGPIVTSRSISLTPRGSGSPRRTCPRAKRADAPSNSAAITGERCIDFLLSRPFHEYGKVFLDGYSPSDADSHGCCGSTLILLSVKVGRIRTTNPKILRRSERILLRGFLCALCVFAVNAGQHFHREDAKDAKKTPRRLICG